MTNQSLSPISAALELFKGVKAMLVGLPIMVSTANIPTQHTEQIVAYQYQTTVQNSDVVAIEQLTASLTAVLPHTMQLLDAVIYLIPMIANEIPEREVVEFSQVLKGVDQLIQTLIKKNDNAEFVQQVTRFNEKVCTMHQTLLSERYKQLADQTLTSRFYQGKQSVGYRFEKNHSFDDFKKAIFG